MFSSTETQFSGKTNISEETKFSRETKLRLSGGKKNLKRCEMGEKNCHVCQQKENKSQKLYCVFLFIYICLIVAPEMYLFDV